MRGFLGVIWEEHRQAASHASDEHTDGNPGDDEYPHFLNQMLSYIAGRLLRLIHRLGSLGEDQPAHSATSASRGTVTSEPIRPSLSAGLWPSRCPA
ncbi:MAG TPA: hypothetical protein VMO52_00465 [Acidimicrobiia bacterium]|nr:hypothetical protein [Acidimicrobiia bacterium]